MQLVAVNEQTELGTGAVIRFSSSTERRHRVLSTADGIVLSDWRNMKQPRLRFKTIRNLLDFATVWVEVRV